MSMLKFKERFAALQPAVRWAAFIVGTIVGEGLVILVFAGVDLWKLALLSLIPFALVWYAQGHL
jgi:hypothetical protein